MKNDKFYHGLDDILAISCPGTLLKGFPVIFSDLSTGRYWQIESQLDDQTFQGSTGLILYRSTLWVATKRSTGKACLIGLDMSTGSINMIDGEFSDVHSILAKDGDLLVVSTADNAIYSLSIEGHPKITKRVLKLDESTQDELHLNGICEWKGEIFVGMFGKRPPGKPWVDAKGGRVFRLKDFQNIAEFMHPHSIGEYNGRLLVIESLTNTVFDVEENSPLLKLDEQLGYLRGATAWSDKLAFGISERRGGSERADGFSIAIAADRRDRLEHIVTVPGPRGVHEIYDLVHLDEWPHGKRRPVNQETNWEGPILGSEFEWSKMNNLSFDADEWNENVLLYDIPLNVNYLKAKMVVMSRMPLVHLKLVLSNDINPSSCNSSIEKWYDIFEGLTVLDLDIGQFSTLRGSFERSSMRMFMVAGFAAGYSGDVEYQFTSASGKALASLTGDNSNRVSPINESPFQRFE
jgi:hypothetical protein